jgi:hypothetical protein
VAEKGKPIVDEAGKPVEGLEGWTLSLAEGDLAVLHSEAAHDSVAMRRERDGGR